MSMLFKSKKIGNVELPNRFVHSATYEGMAKEITEDEIMEIVKAFGAAAKREVEAGADGIQLHGAHGYLINEFLSPFFNSRTDSWGGSDENRFRFLKEIVLETQKTVPDGMPVLVKLSTNDYTPKAGIKLDLAVKYAEWLAELRIGGVETSCGTAIYSYMNMCRGDVPTAELVKSLSWWEKPMGRLMIGKLEGKMDKVSCVSCNKCLAAVPNDLPIYCYNKGFPK